MAEKLAKEKPLSPEQSLFHKLSRRPELAALLALPERLPAAKLYLVGGAVRDHFFDENKPTKDLDFVICGVPFAKLVATLKPAGRLDLVGRDFGVLKFTPAGRKNDLPFDLALPRREKAFGTGGYRDFAAQIDENLAIEDDLSRRDFTINAMAYEIKTQTLVDPFAGRVDLENKLLRAVGDPAVRFQEDRSRVLRALRFACALDFKIEENTWLALGDAMEKIAETRRVANRVEPVVPPEIIGREILKTLAGAPRRAAELFLTSGLLAAILPETLAMLDCAQSPEFHSEGDVWRHTLLALDNLQSEKFRQTFPDHHDDGSLVLAVLLHDIGKPPTKTLAPETGQPRFYGHDAVGAEMAAKICSRLRLPKDTQTKIVFLIKEHLFGLNANLAKTAPTKIARRFLDSPHGDDLLKLIFVDSAASLRADGTAPQDAFYDLLPRLETIKKHRATAPTAKFDGHKIGEILGVTTGPLIGRAKRRLEALRDAGELGDTDPYEKLLSLKDELLTEK